MLENEDGTLQEISQEEYSNLAEVLGSPGTESVAGITNIPESKPGEAPKAFLQPSGSEPIKVKITTSF